MKKSALGNSKAIYWALGILILIIVFIFYIQNQKIVQSYNRFPCHPNIGNGITQIPEEANNENADIEIPLQIEGTTLTSINQLVLYCAQIKNPRECNKFSAIIRIYEWKNTGYASIRVLKEEKSVNPCINPGGLIDNWLSKKSPSPSRE